MSKSMKFFRTIFVILKGLVFLIPVIWGALYLFYSNLPWPMVRLVLAVTFVAFGVWAIWLNHRAMPRWVFAATLIAVFAWFILIPASHNRVWRTDVGIMPRAIIEGDLVKLTGFRNFDFKSRNEFTTKYEERVVKVSDIKSVDLFISYWSIGPVGHTFVSFNFENGPPVSISIETRPEIHEGFDPLASVFKEYELIYVVGDERDIVRWRTNFRDEDVFLYRINVSPEAAQQLFMVYLERINELANGAEWYHLFKNNCGLNIVRYANVAGRDGTFDIRHLLNGWLDRYLYDVGLIDTTMPFEELRRRSHINEAALAADDNPEFSQAIRKSLPGLQ